MGGEIVEVDVKKIDKIGIDTIYLISCFLNQVKPDSEKVSGMDIERVYKFSKWQSVDAMTYMAVSGINNLQNEDIIIHWRDRSLKNIRKNLLLDAERKKLFKFMDEKKIWYMPLKGIVLKEMYPKQGARQMADNDIFLILILDRKCVIILYRKALRLFLITTTVMTFTKKLLYIILKCIPHYFIVYIRIRGKLTTKM